MCLEDYENLIWISIGHWSVVDLDLSSSYSCLLLSKLGRCENGACNLDNCMETAPLEWRNVVMSVFTFWQFCPVQQPAQWGQPDTARGAGRRNRVGVVRLRGAQVSPWHWGLPSTHRATLTNSGGQWPAWSIVFSVARHSTLWPSFTRYGQSIKIEAQIVNTKSGGSTSYQEYTQYKWCCITCNSLLRSLLP